jgi:hypothetical protein
MSTKIELNFMNVRPEDVIFIMEKC